MKTRNSIPPVSSMEHIPLNEIGTRIEELIERCNKGDIGFVLDGDSHSYVLCPARWFDMEVDRDLTAVMAAALKAAISGASEDPFVIASFIRRYILWLDADGVQTISDTIRKATTSSEGNQSMWEQLIEDCQAVLKEKAEEKS